MEKFSRQLWDALYRYIGTKEQLLIRRGWSYINEVHNNWILAFEQAPYTGTEGGSKAEGYQSAESDVDYMFVINNVLVLTFSSVRRQQADLIMETEQVKPGYAYLHVTGKSCCTPWIVHNVQSENCLSSTAFREQVVKAGQEYHQNAVPHGPCSTDKAMVNFDRDIVFGFACNVWPEKASEWIHRHHPNSWPSEDMVKDIVSDGCSLVPIGNPTSTSNHIEWRISFSLAEKKLMHSMNHTQILCYGLLKIFLIHMIESKEELKGLICSYFLKTCLLYSVEDDDITWNKDNLTECFWNCFRRLQNYVRQNNCPNYFIKDNNMLEGKMNSENQAKLIDHLSTLYQNGTQILQKMFKFGMDSSERESEMQCDYELFCVNYPYSFKYNTVIYLVSKLEIYPGPSPLHNTMLTVLRGMFSRLLSQIVYKFFIQNSRWNKKNYKYYTLLRNYILYFVIDFDICTGLLQYATLCYNTGQFGSVINTVKYVLEKFKSHVIYIGFGDVKYDEEIYVSKLCGRGFTAIQKMKISSARAYRVLITFGMFPREIATEVKTHSLQGHTLVPPVVYANALLFLSYRYLGNTEFSHQILNDLDGAVQSRIFVTDLELPVASAILYKCVKLNNEIQLGTDTSKSQCLASLRFCFCCCPKISDSI